MTVDADLVRALFEYDPQTGVVIRKVTIATNAKAGAVVGCKGGEGYLDVGIRKRLYKLHRVIWLHHYGAWPEGILDHVNGDRTDNRIDNLRASTRAENAWNRKRHFNNKSGLKGVSWCKTANKWKGQITCHGIHRFLGYFSNPDEAHAAYISAADELHGEFARAA